MKVRPLTVRLWLSAIDPGSIRLQAAIRAALTLLSLWFTFRLALRLFNIGDVLLLPLFGVLSSIIFLIFIIDLKPEDRKLSLWLAFIPFTGAVLLASSLANHFWLNNLIMLFLFFLAYAVRRYGARAGELALVATVGYYLGFLMRLKQEYYLLFVVLVAVSVLIVYLWQFVLIPYNPVSSLHRGVAAFNHNVALTVFVIRQGLESAQKNNQVTPKMRRQFRRVHKNRRVIEGLFSATVSPNRWSQPRQNRLQAEMYAAEQTLEQLVEAAEQISTRLNEMPGEVVQHLLEELLALEDQLWEATSADGQARLREAGERLQVEIKASLEGKLQGDWVLPVLRLGLGARGLADSISAINTIWFDWQDNPNYQLPAEPRVFPQVNLSDLQKKNPGFVLHPTTILGLQAVLATGLAMLAAYLLNVDTPNLVFWTAFVVIAGSTGESLRRIMMHILGVFAGTVVGVALAVILPVNIWLIVLLVTACLFMAVYMIPTSYTWMIFWLNIAVLLIFTTLGSRALDLLYTRPVSTLLGSVIAALVVIFVMPIHTRNRFIAAMSEFLRAIDVYLDVYITSLTSPAASADVKSAEVEIDESYKNLEQNLPNVAFEYNPLSRAQNRFSNQASSLAALKRYVTSLDDNVGGDPGVLVGDQYAYLVLEKQSAIHANITALNSFVNQTHGEKYVPPAASGAQANLEIDLKEILSAESGSAEAVRNHAIYQLQRIQETIQHISTSLVASEV